MNPLTLEWAQKADGNYAAAKCLAQTDSPILDAICFHAQPCVEKYLKAWLQEANVAFPRTHDLQELLDLIVPTMPAWSAWDADFLILTSHAVDFRYPGKSSSSDDADHALKVCEAVRKAIRENLGLDS
ncbi:MAG: HEPN domain-containing protein [Planctomycetes bacterium]|nr:HEPN domain-containing protein [Planctomycetota bacterium]